MKNSAGAGRRLRCLREGGKLLVELGNVGVSFDVIFKLCEVLEITPRDLFDFRD